MEKGNSCTVSRRQVSVDFLSWLSDPLQESSEGDAGSPSSPGNHLHAVLRQPGRRRDLSDRLHIFQLVFGVLPGTIYPPNTQYNVICVCVYSNCNGREMIGCV